MDNWFEMVRSILQEIGIIDRADLANRLWNCDETGFYSATASKVVLGRRGSKSVHEVRGGTRGEFITVLGCGAADGTCLPPYIVYKNMYSDWTVGGPVGAPYGMSSSGWTDSENFLS